MMHNLLRSRYFDCRITSPLASLRHRGACHFSLRPTLFHHSQDHAQLRVVKLLTKSSNDAGDQLDAQLEIDITESTLALDAIISEVTKSVFVDTATAYVTGEAATTKQFRDSITDAVTPRLDSLNETFLPLLNSYIEQLQENVQKKNKTEQQDLLGVLLAVKSEVLNQLSEKLPPEMRILQLALKVSGAQQRVDIFKKELTNTTTIKAETLALTVGRLIQDLENIDKFIPDYPLLAQLCLVREELWQLANEDAMMKAPSSSGTESVYTTLGGVPQQEVAFLKELMHVDSSDKRRSILDAAFRGVDHGIRPGSFMDCIKAIQKEMNEKNDVDVAEFGDSFSEKNSGVLIRLEEIWRDSIVVLEDVAGDAIYSP